MNGILITVGSSAIIGLFGYFIVAQKNDIIYTLREEVNRSKTDLMGELEKERENRLRLAVALRDAGVNIPVAVLFSYASSSTDPQVTEALATRFASALPVLDSKESYLKVAEQNAKDGRPNLAYSILPDGTGIVAFTASPVEASAISAQWDSAELLFNDQPQERLPLRQGSLVDVLSLVKNDNIMASNLYKVNSIAGDEAMAAAAQ